MSAFTDWLELRDEARVLLIDLVVRSGDVEATRYVSNRVFKTGAADTPANTIYVPILVGDPFVERSASEALLGGSRGSYGGLDLARTDYVDLDTWFDDVPLRMTARLGSPAWRIADFGVIGTWGLDDWEVRTDGSLRVQIQDLFARILAHENPNVITDGASEGQPVPEVAGTVRMYSGTQGDWSAEERATAAHYRSGDRRHRRRHRRALARLEDSVNHIYRLADDVIEIIEVLKSDGTATTAYSSSATYLNRGRLKMNAKQDGPFYVTFKCGKDSGANWLSTPGEIAEYLLTRESPVYQGRAAAATATTITLDDQASSVDDYYNGDAIEIVLGTADGELNTITDYDGATRTATVSAWGVTPDIDDTFEVAHAHRVGPLDPSEIAVGTIAAFDTAAPYACGAVVTGPLGQTIDQLIGESCGGWWAENREGELELGVLNDPAGTPVLEIGEGDIVRGTLKIRRDKSLVWRLRAQYQKYYSTLGDDLNASVSEDDGDDLRREWRTVSPLLDHSIRQDYGARAGSLTLETLIDDQTDAETELARRWAILKGPHSFFEFETRTGPFQIGLGALIRLTHRRYSLAAGKDLIVVGIKDYYTRNRAKVTAWGPA